MYRHITTNTTLHFTLKILFLLVLYVEFYLLKAPPQFTQLSPVKGASNSFFFRLSSATRRKTREKSRHAMPEKSLLTSLEFDAKKNSWEASWAKGPVRGKFFFVTSLFPSRHAGKILAHGHARPWNILLT